MRDITPVYQVTFSDGSNPHRKFIEVGQYPDYIRARDAAQAHIMRFYDGAIQVISEVPDTDYEGSEDWYIDAGKSYKGVVSINCLPLTLSSKGSSKPPYSHLDEPVVDILAEQAVMS